MYEINIKLKNVENLMDIASTIEICLAAGMKAGQVEDGDHISWREVDEFDKPMHTKDSAELYADRKLYDAVMKFMKDNEVTCAETIHQVDRVVINACDFIEKLFYIVEDDLEIDMED